MFISLKRELLNLISTKSSLDTLLDSQITYNQIAIALVGCLNENLIKNSEDGYILTDIGKQVLLEKKPFEVIKPLEEFKTNKTYSLDQIYIPDYIKGVIKELKN